LLPPGKSTPQVLEALHRHGIRVERVKKDVELAVEVYTVTKITREGKAFQKHSLATVEAKARLENRRVAAGTLMVRTPPPPRTAQPLGTLATFLLEPQSEDGLVAWNFFDADLKEGADFPVLRMPASALMTTDPVPPGKAGGPKADDPEGTADAQKGEGKGGKE